MKWNNCTVFKELSETHSLIYLMNIHFRGAPGHSHHCGASPFGRACPGPRHVRNVPCASVSAGVFNLRDGTYAMRAAGCPLMPRCATQGGLVACPLGCSGSSSHWVADAHGGQRLPRLLGYCFGDSYGQEAEAQERPLP